MDQLDGNGNDEDEALTGPEKTKATSAAFPICRGQRRNRQIVADQSYPDGVCHQQCSKRDGHHGYIRDGGGRDRRQYSPLRDWAYILEGQRRAGAGQHAPANLRLRSRWCRKQWCRTDFGGPDEPVNHISSIPPSHHYS
jgi:hypothetical protein